MKIWYVTVVLVGCFLLFLFYVLFWTSLLTSGLLVNTKLDWIFFYKLGGLSIASLIWNSDKTLKCPTVALKMLQIKSWLNYMECAKKWSSMECCWFEGF